CAAGPNKRRPAGITITALDQSVRTASRRLVRTDRTDRRPTSGQRRLRPRFLPGRSTGPSSICGRPAGPTLRRLPLQPPLRSARKICEKADMPTGFYGQSVEEQVCLLSQRLKVPLQLANQKLKV